MRVPVPLIDQRSQSGLDGRPPEDGNQDCVPCSLAAMCAGVTDTPQNGDAWHDAVYGQGYIGLQAPARYVAYARAKGMALQYIDRGSGAANIAFTVAQLAAGRPVLLSIPSDWNDSPPHSPYAHMVAACDVSADGKTLTAMNPWGGFYQAEGVAWWAERLDACSYHGIWIGQGTTAEVLSMWTKETNSAGQITGAHDGAGHSVGPGIYSVLAAQGWLNTNALYADYLAGVEGVGGAVFLCVLDDGKGQPGAACEWIGPENKSQPGASYSALHLAQSYLSLSSLVKQQEAEIAALKAAQAAQPAPDPAPVPAPARSPAPAPATDPGPAVVSPAAALRALAASALAAADALTAAPAA